MSTIVPTVYADPERLRVDYDAVAQVADHARRQGACAVVVGGLASEPWALRTAEAQEVTRVVVAAVGRDVPVIAGLDAHPRVADAAAVEAAGLGATHLMVRLPAGLPDQPDVAAYLDRLTEVSGLPVVLQDVPQVSGRGLSVAALRALAQSVPGVRALKLEALNGGPAVTATADLPLPVIVGWAGLHLVERLERGARGCMLGAGLTPVFARILALWWEGRRAEATALYQRVLPLVAYASQSLDLMVATNKHVLRRLGVIGQESSAVGEAHPDAVHRATVDRLVGELLESGVLPSAS